MDAGKKLGSEVCDRAHKKTARASAPGEEFVSLRVALGNQVLAAGDKVGKSVPFFQKLAVVIPGTAEIFAAADMSHGVDESAVEKAEPC